MKTRLILLFVFVLGCLCPAYADEADSPAAFAMGRPIPKLESLPMPAQLAIKKKAGRRQIARIVREMCGDVPAFRVAFREKGRNPEIYVGDDGAFLTPEEIPPSLARSLFGTRFEETPREVQDAIRREIGEGKILKIEKGSRERGECYRVEFSHGLQRAATIIVADSGEVLERPRNAARSEQASASTE